MRIVYNVNYKDRAGNNIEQEFPRILSVQQLTKPVWAVFKDGDEIFKEKIMFIGIVEIFMEESIYTSAEYLIYLDGEFSPVAELGGLLRIDEEEHTDIKIKKEMRVMS
jgi:hypothetical protein